MNSRSKLWMRHDKGASGVTVITGASSGIGREIAYLLADNEVSMLLTGRDDCALAETAERCRARGAKTEVIQADLVGSSLHQGVTAIAECARELGGATGLIASAGLGWAGPVEQTPVPVIANLVDVNVAAPLMLSRALLPQLLAAGRGRIVLIGSIAGAVGVAGEAVYSGTKAALIGYADALRAEVARRDVTVTVALPGPVDTAFFARRGSPYARRHPAPLPADSVARQIVHAAVRGTPEVYVPRWLSIAPRVRGVAPTLYRRLAARWG